MEIGTGFQSELTSKTEDFINGFLLLLLTKKKSLSLNSAQDFVSNRLLPRTDSIDVPTVRQHSEMAAYETKGTLVRINPRDPEMPGHVNGISIPMNSLVTLEAINKLLK